PGRHRAMGAADRGVPVGRVGLVPGQEQPDRQQQRAGEGDQLRTPQPTDSHPRASLYGAPVSGLASGPDGRPRCAWAVSAPEYVAYHDEEWGRPVRDDDALYERLTLEAFQSGLSWLTILHKRPAFRAAFAGFAIGKVAGFGTADVERLLADPGIVRNRAK